jgi:hypothetical protein
MSRSLDGERVASSRTRPSTPMRTMASGARSPLKSALGVIHSSSPPAMRALTLPPVAVMSDCR